MNCGDGTNEGESGAMSHGVFGTLDGVYTLEYNDVPPEMRFEKPCVFELCAVAEDQDLAIATRC